MCIPAGVYYVALYVYTVQLSKSVNTKSLLRLRLHKLCSNFEKSESLAIEPEPELEPKTKPQHRSDPSRACRAVIFAVFSVKFFLGTLVFFR